ncbi:prepilin-type N-terminal cleavage/methylation domain-containing protein [Candidatus Clostridium stratigraminis]|uniref:Prepilin-type N-terminal cleavage/methylation domain-containing protein n=1 Tax=Candidatus Clostridium stratigraminis TaxID=3381661 RepID=A0ABW8T2F5_9CLOT
MFYFIKGNKIGGKKKKGFTLIEIIVAVTIIIILSALAVPKVSGYISKAKEANVISKGKQIYNAAMWSYSAQGNKFEDAKIESAVKDTTNISETGLDVDASDNSLVKITFINDGKSYSLSINKTDNTYMIKDKDNSQIFSSAEDTDTATE